MEQDASYTGLIPEVYERDLGPMLFAVYAEEVAARAKARQPRRILEVAAGTGIVTEALRRALPDATIEATDLNQAMIDFASAKRPKAATRWSRADALALPFDDGAFDLVVCQFGAMFFPDRIKAFREARRVLAGRGAYIVSLWDGLQANDLPRVVSEAAMTIFPDDPPLFLRRTPYGHGDPVAIERDLRDAGFSNVAIERIEKRSRGPTPRAAASGFVEGTPLRFEIEARDARRLQAVVEAATLALSQKFGDGPVDALMAAFVFIAEP
ncbi:MAG TPA: class I SAM-dependent methyltransferase [Candidatus Eremiobacteraceae bacterium]|jgi:SAM-dependent methyltransferase